MGMLTGRAAADAERQQREQEQRRMRLFTEGGEAGTLPAGELVQLHAEFVERKANPPERINNASLPVGAPMHYYCQACGHKAATLPELHTCAVPQYCPACNAAIAAAAVLDK